MASHSLPSLTTTPTTMSIEDKDLGANGEQKSPTTSSYPKERRFKLSRACDRCRRRRIRCDEGHPCQSCLTANSACTFEEPGKRTHPHKSKRSATLEDRMHHLETLIQSIPTSLLNGATLLPNGINGLVDPNNNNSLPIVSNVPYPSGIPPPSLHHYPLTNPSTHFPVDDLTEITGRLSIAPSYLYFDDEGSTRWQGETSGLPLLDLLVERTRPPPPPPSAAETDGFGASGVGALSASQLQQQQQLLQQQSQPNGTSPSNNNNNTTTPTNGIKTEPCANDWFPDRVPKPVDSNPESLWKMITSRITPELMDSLVQCFLSTTHYLMPFLHVPTFLSDYGNPRKWGESGFACFILAVCAISSRHVDDVRVRSDPNDSLSAGLAYFELFNTIRSTKTDRPTMYTIQGVFVAAVYAVGLGKLSKGSALLAEAITLSIDAGIHRSADIYDLFDPIEDEIRKRTFFCVYLWDKQAGAAFGRPPMIRLRDADCPEPALVDDEYITNDRLGPQPPHLESRMAAFVWTLRIYIVLEAVLDTPPSRMDHQHPMTASSIFRSKAAGILSGFRRHNDLREEELLLDEIVRDLPAHWKCTQETSVSEDVIRITQSQRLHCLEQFVRMLIHRHRFSELVMQRWTKDPAVGGEQTEKEREAMMACHVCALRIVESHMHMAASSLMTYYGVHVIHQLTQAGRTLIAILLNCRTEDLRPLIHSSLDALRSCVGLLRRFSGRYVCGLRNGDLIEEFCRLTGIPLDAPQGPNSSARPAWLRPVPKKYNGSSRTGTSNDSPETSDSSSPAAGMDTALFTSSPDFTQAPLTPEGPFSFASGGGGGGQPTDVSSFLDASQLVSGAGGDSLTGGSGGLSPAQFMALLDGASTSGYDLGTMFHPGLMQQAHPSMGHLNGMGGGGGGGINGMSSFLNGLSPLSVPHV